jgi:hypothetical protein
VPSEFGLSSAMGAAVERKLRTIRHFLLLADYFSIRGRRCSF